MTGSGRLRRAVVVLAGLAWAAMPLAAPADEILFNNGDRLSGVILSAADGKLKFKSTVAGEITVDLKDVKTFASDDPVTLRLQDGTQLRQPVAAADQPGQVALKPGGAVAPQNIPLDRIKRINPDQTWTGALVVGGLLTRGNSDTEQLNVALDLARRTERDRITLGAGYQFGRQENLDTGIKSTTTDNWFAKGKYDYFFTDRFYAFGAVLVERDRIAELDLRLAPAGGVGYQWVERPDFNFSTEAGLGWVYEDFSNAPSEDHVAAHLAYHVDRQLNEDVTLFHNLTYLPSLEALSDYNLLADAGVRAQLTEQFFTEFKLEWRYDATPAPTASRSDLRYILGVGWRF